MQVVVAESFDAIVNQPDKDVLIQFYSPSCPRCKKLEPVYTELAETTVPFTKIKIVTLNLGTSAPLPRAKRNGIAS